MFSLKSVTKLEDLTVLPGHTSNFSFSVQTSIAKFIVTRQKTRKVRENTHIFN
jgi:hypothetical protein